MTAMQPFNDLLKRLRDLDSHLSEQLMWVVVENRPQVLTLEYPAEPQSLDLYLVGHYEDEVTKLQGLVKAAQRMIERLNQESFEPAQAATCLADCGQAVQAALAQFLAEPCSFERLAELSEIEHGMDNPWIDWAVNVKFELERCLNEFLATENALALCWLSLTEEIYHHRSQVQNMNIGPQISLPLGTANV